MSAAPPVFGLILAGGASSRMHRDKATLLYGGKQQLDRACDLAGRHVPQVYVSVRASQLADPARAHRPVIVDSIDGAGPIVGIRSAFAHLPDVAWLVIACDLPYLTDAAVATLLSARNPGVLATAYRSAHDGLPEPLCAVWEPAAAPALADYQVGGRQCPRKFLMQAGAHLLDPLDPRALDNVNTPEEYAAAVGVLEAPPAAQSMHLHIRYFALLREQAGRSEETIETSAATPADLYAELNARYGFALAREQLKVAVNGEFSEWTRKLLAGDGIVFIPPVSGG